MEEINPRKIKAALIEAGISNTQIAAEIGLTRAAITQTLDIKRNAGWKTINKIIAAFEKIKTKGSGGE